VGAVDAGEITPATARTYKETLGLFSEAVGLIGCSRRSSLTRSGVAEGSRNEATCGRPAFGSLRLHVFYGWAILNGFVAEMPPLGQGATAPPVQSPRAASCCEPTALEVLAAITQSASRRCPEEIGFDYLTGRVRDRRSRQVVVHFPGGLQTVRRVLGPDKPISSIARSDVEHWIEHMNVAPATVRLRLGTLRNFFQWAVVNGYLTADPTLGIRAPRIPRRSPVLSRRRTSPCCSSAARTSERS